MRSLVFLIDVIFPAAPWPWGRLNFLTEMSTRNLPEGKGRPARKADNLIANWADCLGNVGALKSHNPMGLHGLLQG
jgi:hypothetical protein